MIRIPRFALLVAGIALAGAGGIVGMAYGHVRIGAGLAGCGAALAAAEIVAIGRRRESDDAVLGRDLAAEQHQVAALKPELDWAERELAGVKEPIGDGKGPPS